MIEILQSGLVYRNPATHLRSRQAFHPSLVSLGRSEWLCTFDIGEAVESLDYATYVARSHDDGATWRLEGRMFDDVADRPTTHTVRTSLMSDGAVLGVGARFYRDDPEAGLTNRDTLGFVPMDLITLTSRDAGRTWSVPRNVGPPLVGPAFETSHSVLEMADGRRLWPLSIWRGWNGELPSGQKAFVMISGDGGETWPRYAVTFDGGRDGHVHWEQSLTPLADGRLLAVAWEYDVPRGRTLPTPFSLSADGGESFGPPLSTGFLAQTCKAVGLPDGRVLFVYRRDDQAGLWASVSRLDGEGLENLAEAPLWGTRLAGSGMAGEGSGADELSALKFGYPSLRMCANGDVLVAFWCFEDGTTVIRWIRLRIS